MKPTTQAEEQEFQQKYMQYNAYKQQAQGLVQEISMLNQTAQSLDTAREVLTNLEKSKENNEILVPIGGNTFLKAKMADKDNVLVGVGSDVVLKKSTSDTITKLTEQLETLKNSGEELGKQMHEIDGKLRELEPQIQEMVQAVRKEKKQ